MKVDRISIINKDDNEFSEDYQCDLCDKTNYPMLSWGCTHDDDYIRTIVCLVCIKDLNTNNIAGEI